MKIRPRERKKTGTERAILTPWEKTTTTRSEVPPLCCMSQGQAAPSAPLDVTPPPRSLKFHAQVARVYVKFRAFLIQFGLIHWFSLIFFCSVASRYGWCNERWCNDVATLWPCETGATGIAGELRSAELGNRNTSV
jgi:hypothetical protein